MLLAVPELRRVGRHQGTGAVNRAELKRWVKDLTPPLLYSSLRRLVREGWRRRPPEWQYVPEGLRPGPRRPPGLERLEHREAYRSKLSVQPRDASTAPGRSRSAHRPRSTSERPNVSRPEHDAWRSRTCRRCRAMGASGCRCSTGAGAWGTTATLPAPCSPDTVELEYHCKDMPVICEYGRQALPEITFWDDDDDCFAAVRLRVRQQLAAVQRAVADDARGPARSSTDACCS